ncbi:MAG TPA: hypothetical protein VG797_11400, partial [Phycisphaerales bacterium]|nr:hypothetical protein [Phycisphaerales bacterium]
MGKAANSIATNGQSEPNVDDLRRLEQVVEAIKPLNIRPEQMRGFGALPGADEEPWDLILTASATDEHAALEGLARRYGLPFESEPKANESAERFYERIPAQAARRHQVAGLRSDGHSMVVATSQPMQPAVFATLERTLEMPIEVVLAPRGAVGSLINRGFEQRQDLVTEIVEDIPLDER